MSRRPPGTMIVLLGPDLSVALQMRWARHLATACRMDLLILERVEGREERVVEIALDEPPGREAAGVTREVMRFIDEAPELIARTDDHLDTKKEEEGGKESRAIQVQFKQVQYTSLPSLRRLVVAELHRSKAELFTLAREQLFGMTDADLVRERRLLLRYVPCKVVVCQGLQEGMSLSRILVATASGRNRKAALQLGQDLTSQAGQRFTALHVNPSVGADAEQVGERRLGRLLKRSLGDGHAEVDRRVVVADRVDRGVRRVWEEGNHDLVVLGAPRSRAEASIGTKLGKDVTFAIVSAATPIRSSLRHVVEESIQRIVPQIEREDRVALVDRVQSSAAWNFDFLTLMVLSTTMAAIGLMQNSAAVVIGAMLVAPLMTPLLGLGLALVQGNPVLARVSLRSVALGLCVSLLGGFLVGVGNLSFVEPTREMLARGGPGLLDLFVAFAAGLAAAYASSRPTLIAALPGVAIAAALVPPIATSGLALSLGDFPLAIGALLLFGINMVTIVFASMTSLWLVGIRNPRKTSRRMFTIGGAVIVSVLALVVYLSLQPKVDELTEEFPAGLAAAVQETLGTDYQLENLSVAYDELGVQLRVSVAGGAPVPEELATEVRTVASDHYDQPVRVRLLTRIEILARPVTSEGSG